MSQPLRRLCAWLVRRLLAIRTRLLVINLVLVLIPVVGLAWARAFEREGLAALERDMRHVADALRSIVEDRLRTGGAIAPALTALEPAVRTIAERTRMRVRLLDRAGVLVVDSHWNGPPEGSEWAVSPWRGTSAQYRRTTDAPIPDLRGTAKLSERREIVSARRGVLGTATRVHERDQRVFLFLALPIVTEHRVCGLVYITRSSGPVLLSMYRIRRNLYQLMAVALSFTVLTSLFLAATISRPLTRLTRRAQRIANGDRTVSLALTRRDEIGDLARAFDALVGQLDARAKYIAEFAANLSHEFKTPLTSIRGAAELLADGADDDTGARRRFLDNIQADVGRLDHLVSRVLELSRLEATLETRESFDLSACVSEIAARYRPIDVGLTIDDGPMMVFALRAHVESAVNALLENAVRHSPEPSTVCCTVRRGEDLDCLVQVTDHGSGIPAALRQKVFDRFFTTERQSGGSGLGLAIVALCARAHGGSVEIADRPLGGAVFELRLPVGERNG